MDGRMYFGKVLKVHGGKRASPQVNNSLIAECLNLVEVDLLFDDGVQYTAPVANVRKRVSSYLCCLPN